jgi:hypothetical protein
MANGLFDLLVARASTEISSYRSPNLFLCRIRGFIKQSLGGHEHARGAEPTLNGAMFNKGLLQGMKSLCLNQIFPENGSPTNGFYRIIRRFIRKRFVLLIFHLGCARQTLHGSNFTTVYLNSQNQTGVHRPTIQDNGTGSAFPDLAAIFGARQINFFPYYLKQGILCVDADFMDAVVHP